MFSLIMSDGNQPSLPPLSVCSVKVAQSQFHCDDELLMLELIMQPGSDVRSVLFVKLNVMMRDLRMMMLMMQILMMIIKLNDDGGAGDDVNDEEDVDDDH